MSWVDDDDDLFSARRLARTTDPHTSHEAAESQVADLREKQEKVLALLREDGPMADHTLTALAAVRFGWPPGASTARTRRRELVAMGLVEDTGKRVKLPTKRNAIIWRARAGII